jgi:hypothetical protein
MNAPILGGWIIEREAELGWRVIQTHTNSDAAERAFRALQLHFPTRVYRMRKV